MSSLKRLTDQFHQISHWAFCGSGFINCLNDSATLNKMAAMPIYSKTLKSLLQNQESFKTVLVAVAMLQGICRYAIIVFTQMSEVWPMDILFCFEVSSSLLLSPMKQK